MSSRWLYGQLYMECTSVMMAVMKALLGALHPVSLGVLPVCLVVSIMINPIFADKETEAQRGGLTC